MKLYKYWKSILNYMKRKLRKLIEDNTSKLEQKGLLLINHYGPKIRDKLYWENGTKMSGGVRTYVPPGGNHPKPKPRSNMSDDNWEYDSSEFLLMKEFLSKYLKYDTRNARSVRKWYGL